MRALLFKIRRAFRESSLIKLYFESARVRVIFSLALSIVMNTVYVIFNVTLAIIYKSASFFMPAVYYLFILSVRYRLLGAAGRDGDSEKQNKTLKRAGISLLFIDFVISVFIFYSVRAFTFKRYGALVFTVLSLHSVYTVIMAALGIYKSRRDRLPTHRAAYSVRLASVSVSFFNLSSVTVVSLFGAGAVSRVIILVLGIAVSFAVLLLSLSMIFQSTKRKGIKLV